MKRQDAMPIGEILRNLLKTQHLDNKLDEMKLIKLWPQIMGQTIAEYTQRIYIKNGILYISLTSAVLRSELLMCREMLIKRLNEEMGTPLVKDIIFR
ncbi:MAG: DUF721 domain-containing protein [Bacteroidaceae bacterium]|nr:DUF721 domain-containing protein [Bacteroidaceae bacterium]